MKKSTKREYKITKIQLFDHAEKVQISECDYEILYSYSANIIINDNFIVQIHGNSEESTIDGICHSDDCYWITKENQDNAFESSISDSVIAAIEADGFENNIWYLEERSETMHSENKQYRK